MYVCTYVCIYIYIYTYIHTYIRTQDAYEGHHADEDHVDEHDVVLGSITKGRIYYSGVLYHFT